MGISSKLLAFLMPLKDSNFNRIIMNTLTLIILSLTAIATAAPGGWRCGRSPGWCRNKGMSMSGGRRGSSLKTIAGTAAATPALSTLLAAVKAAGFAPTNDAFGKLPEGTIPTLLKPENKDQLAAILLRHVLPTRIMAGDIRRGTTKVKTVGGEEIEVINNGRGVSIRSSAGSSRVIKTDIMTSNGVVHLVDTVF